MMNANKNWLKIVRFSQYKNIRETIIAYKNFGLCLEESFPSYDGAKRNQLVTKRCNTPFFTGYSFEMCVRQGNDGQFDKRFHNSNKCFAFNIDKLWNC